MLNDAKVFLRCVKPHFTQLVLQVGYVKRCVQFYIMISIALLVSSICQYISE